MIDTVKILQSMVREADILILSELNGANHIRRKMVGIRDDLEELLDVLHAPIPHPGPPHLSSD